ncbi:MAG: hypothetical protein WC673_00615 [Candidatus Paceibacterota bacterium]|jgi:hypothetical protein
MNTQTTEQVAERALKLIREGHSYNPAVMLAVYEVRGTADDFLEVLSVLRGLVSKVPALRFVARKMARAMDRPVEPEFQTCFPV